MNEIMVPISFMKIGFGIVVPLIVVYFLTVIVKNQIVKFFLYLVKMLAYFGLAWFMWKYYKTWTEINIVSAFTFIFCCFESADNFISMLSIPIEYIRDLRKQKFEYEIKRLEH